MRLNVIKSLAERLQALKGRKDRKKLAQEVANVPVEDVADALSRLEAGEAIELLRQMDDATAGEVMVELPDELARQITADLPDATLAHYLDLLPVDDALDLEEDIGTERYEQLLEQVPRNDRDRIQRLRQYPEESVGREMTESFFEVGPETSVETILSDIRAAPDEKYEMVNDIYVLDSERHLLGVFSLRKALRASTSATAKELMNREVIFANATDDEEVAARTVSRYGLYALPVLDERGRMVGLFTGDDAQEVLTEHETEDVLAVGAVSGHPDAYLALNVLQLVKRRLPWLGALFFAETLTGLVMRHYGESGSGLDISPLTFFIPLLIGAGGNVGAQVTTTVTRALALDEVNYGDWFRVLRREVATALLIGAALGLAGFFRAWLGWGTAVNLSLTVGLALPCIVLWAGLVGSLLPIGAKRLGIDPAVMSAPFITTLVDATGLIIYFEIARVILP